MLTILCYYLTMDGWQQQAGSRDGIRAFVFGHFGGRRKRAGNSAPRERAVLRRLRRLIGNGLAALVRWVVPLKNGQGQGADMDEKQEVPTDAGAGGEEGRKPQLL